MTELRSLDILIVEDNEADAELIRENIKGGNNGFHLRSASTFEEAERKIRDQAPHAVLLDLNLPDSAASVTFPRMMEVVKDRFPIIIMTGLDDQDLIDEAFDLGAQEYLIKGQTGMSVGHLTRHAVERHRVAMARLQASRHTGTTEVLGPEGLAAREAVRETRSKVSMDELSANITQLRQLAEG